MKYPVGYGEAEHRRALDALLSDLARHGQTRSSRQADRGPGSKAPGPKPARVLGATSASGDCRIELCMHPPMLSKV